MKVISQLLEYFVERGALTSVQLEALAKQGLYERPGAEDPSAAAPVSTADPLEQLWREPVAPKPKRRGGRPKKAALEQANLVAWIKQSIPKWEPSLEGLAPVARRLASATTVERAAIAIRNADPAKLADAVLHSLKLRDPAFDILWTAVEFDRYHEVLQFGGPGARGPVAAAYRAILQCEEGLTGSKYAWLLKDPAVRWVYNLALAQRRLLAAVGCLCHDQPEAVGRALARDPHPIGYAALLLLHKARRFPDPSKIVTRLQAHAAPVQTLAMDHDGARIFSGTGDGTISIHDALTGVLLESAPPNIEPRFVVRQEKAAVEVWDRATGGSRGRVYPQLAKCAALAFQPDIGGLIVAGTDGTVQIFDLATDARSEVWSFGVSPPKMAIDGGRMQVALLEDGELKRYDLRSSSWKRVVRGMPRVKHETVAYLPDTHWMAVVASSFTGIVDPRRGDVLNFAEESAPDHPVRLCAAPDRKRLISAGAFGDITLYNWVTGPTELRWNTGGQRVLEIAISPVAPLLAVSAGKVVTIWNYTTAELIRELPPQVGDILALSFHPQDGRLCTGSIIGQVKLWDPESWRDRQFAMESLGAVTCLAFDPEGKHLATGGGTITGGVVRYWDLAAGRELWSRAGHASPSQSVAVSPDGVRLFSSSRSALAAWNLPGAGLAWEQYQWGGFTRLESCLDGRGLAAGSAGGRIDLFDTGTGKAAGVLLGHDADIAILNGVPAGTLASADERGVVRFWDIPLLRCAATMKTGSRVSALATSGDGRSNAAGCEDGTIRLRPASFFAPGPGEAVPQRPLPEWDDWPRAWTQALMMDPALVARLLAYYTENMEACFSPSLYSQSSYGELALHCPDNWNFW